MTTQPQRFIAGAAHFIGKRGMAHGVQQRSKQGEVGPSVQCIRITRLQDIWIKHYLTVR